MTSKEIDENEIAAIAQYEEAERTKKACIEAYRSLNRACMYLEEDMMSSAAFAASYSAQKDHILVAQKYLPKIYAKFMALWTKRCEKDKRKG